jgi:phosphatidylserine synthase
VVAAVVHSRHFFDPISDRNWAIAWFALLVVLGGLMTSTVRYYSFKDIPWTRKQPSITIILLCLLVGIIWKYSEMALVIIAGTYATIPLILHIGRFLRRRLATRTA